jgi:hypothetical protein
MPKHTWVEIRLLGSGGQGSVALVRKEGTLSPEEAIANAIRPLVADLVDRAKRPDMLAKLSDALGLVVDGERGLAAQKRLINPDDESIARLGLEAQV